MPGVIIPFDSGKSYVVRDLPPPVEQYPLVDSKGRSAKDREYLENYEIIFLAASCGDLKDCQKVIDSGFRDFDAESFGKFGTSSGAYLNGFSPRKIAQYKNQTAILQLFDSFSSKTYATDNAFNSDSLKPNENTQFSPEEQEEYNSFIEFVKSMPAESMKDVIKSAIASSYTFEEMIVIAPQLGKLEKEVQWKAFLRKRIDLPFHETKRLERANLMALRDFIDTQTISA